MGLIKLTTLKPLVISLCIFYREGKRSEEQSWVGDKQLARLS